MAKNELTSRDEVKNKGQELVDYSIKDLFTYVKEAQVQMNDERFDKKYASLLEISKNAKQLGQKQLLLDCALEFNFLQRMQEQILPYGFDTYLDFEELDMLMSRLRRDDANYLLLSPIANFPRQIPAGPAKRIEQAQKVFDDVYILYTDYTGKDRQVADTARVEKDPIAFGVMRKRLVNDVQKKTITYKNAFFIADWVDEQCDLTLDKLLALAEEKDMPMKPKEVVVDELGKMFEDTLSSETEQKLSLNLGD